MKKQVPPLAIELIDRQIAKYEAEQQKYLRQRELAERDVRIAQDTIHMYGSFILDLQESKEAIQAAQTGSDMMGKRNGT